MQLAQLNIARARFDMTGPEMADFVGALDAVNALAERSPGFIWRLKDDTGTATAFNPFNDARLIVNLSVWASLEDLKRFVWETVHKRVYDKKVKWFEALPTPHLVMWWVEDGHRPDVAEAKARLELLTARGASVDAFGWEGLASQYASVGSSEA